MSIYLVYFSEQFVQQTARTQEALRELKAIGSLRSADFNVWTVATDRGLNEICRIVQAASSDGAGWFAAEISELGRGGEVSFYSALAAFPVPTS